MSKKLAGKVALVTGGSRGIGTAIANRLAREGADVAITYLKSQGKADAVVKELEGLGVRSKAFQADQASTSQMDRMVQEVAKKFGHIDIFVANAGIFQGSRVDDSTFDLQAVTALYETNVFGIVAGVKAALPYMNDGGRIILIGSVLGHCTPFVGQADYSATKAALLGYTRGWARDLGRKNITVNCVEPGPIETDMTPDNTDFAQSIKQLLAIQRLGRPEEVAYAVAFLASEEASYITGSSICVDGGMSA